jgi:hypothetical protein
MGNSPVLGWIRQPRLGRSGFGFLGGSWKKKGIKELLSDQVRRESGLFGDRRATKAFIKVQSACQRSWQQELPRKDICLEFTPFMHTVILNPL